jgi:acetyl-CoA acetyltransferase
VRAVIIGVGETRYARWGGIADASEFALACQAVLAALDDAGLTSDDVDGLTSFAEDRNEAVLVAQALGIPELRFADMVWLPGGGGAPASVARAALAVQAGLAEVVVAYRALCQGQFVRFGAGPGQVWPRVERGLLVARTLVEAEFGWMVPYGVYNATTGMAMIVRRHMHLYGTTTEHLGRVAVQTRAHANRNPRAVMHDRPMTLADHATSPIIADPLRLYDCCLETDGACAVVVTTPERARDCRTRPVEILGWAEAVGHRYGYGGFANHNMPEEDYATGGGTRVARRLWERTGLGPDDVDVAQIYDHYTGMVLLALEDFGFCGRGESGPFVEAGGIDWPGGRLPINTAGGSLSEAYVHGLNHVVEGVRQLRGESTSPVPGAEVCLVTGAAGVPGSALLLGAGR